MAKTSRMAELYKLFTHPIVAMVGTLTGVIGLPLSFWFYYQGLPSRAMNVLEPPVRSVFVNRDVPAALEVRVNGTPISKKDVFAAQLAIWNNDNQSIRPENVLTPVTFVTTEGTQIVDAKIVRKTRELCDASVSILPGGESAQLGWKILEPQDGVIVQLVLVGSQTSKIGLKGEIEAGGRPRYVRQRAKEQPEQQLWSGSVTLVDWVLYLGIPVICLWGVVVLVFREIPRQWMKRRTLKGAGELAGALVGAVFCGGLAWLIATAGYDVLTGRDRVPGALVSVQASQPAAVTP